MQKHWAERVLAWGSALGRVGVLAVLGSSGCMGPSGWPEPVEEGTKDEPNVAVETEALTTPVQGVYVVTSEASNGYCDAVLFAGNHGAAIQSCIDRANADGGGVVLIRSGLYSSGTWPLNVKRGVTLKGDGHGVAYLSPTGTPAQIIGSVADHSTVEDLRFNVTAVSEGVIRLGAVDIDHFAIRIANNIFDHSTQAIGVRYGVYVSPGLSLFRDITIDGNIFTSTSPSALNPVDFEGDIQNVRVQDNTLDASNGGTIRLQGTNSSATGVVVSGNVLKTSSAFGHGIIIAGAAGTQIKGNTIGNYSTPVAISGPPLCSAAVTGNFMEGEPFVHTNCVPRTLFVGNTENRVDAGGFPAGTRIGKKGVLVRAHRSGVQSFTAGTPEAIAFNTLAVDNGHNYLIGNRSFKAPVAGAYHVHACARLSATNFAASDNATILLNVIGSSAYAALFRTTRGGSTDSFSICVDDIVSLVRGDELQVLIDSGGSGARTVNGTNVYSTYIHIQQVSD